MKFNFEFDFAKPINEQFQTLELMAVANGWNEDQLYAFTALAISPVERPNLLPSDLEAAEYGKLNVLRQKILQHANGKQDPDDAWNKLLNSSKNPGETVNLYVNRLLGYMRIARPNMSADDINFLLRPKVIQCVDNETLRLTLNADKKLTVKELIEKVEIFAKLSSPNDQVNAIDEEMESQNVAAIRSQNRWASKHAKSTYKKNECMHCGSFNHKSFDCRHDAICRNCGKKGHLSRICRNRPGNVTGEAFRYGKLPRTH